MDNIFRRTGIDVPEPVRTRHTGVWALSSSPTPPALLKWQTTPAR